MAQVGSGSVKKLTATAYQGLAIRLRIAGLQAYVHRVSDKSNEMS